ncbi:MAG TPA: SIS domain-containing protein [Acidobacteriaceae bacterium]|nr:SIS domain-containing protein [Acidobacteriaceae bacterium]
MKEFVRTQIQNSLGTLNLVLSDETIHACLIAEAEEIAAALHKGKKLMIAGNGGSAADAQHLAAEFVSRLTIDRPALHAIALTTDSSILTAIGNDYGYERVFMRQIEAIGQPGDIFLGISTSGNSPNILCALQQCRTMGIRALGLTGGSAGKMTELCDALVVVPTRITQNIQEAHLMLEHILCGLVERSFFGKDRFPDS